MLINLPVSEVENNVIWCAFNEVLLVVAFIIYTAILKYWIGVRSHVTCSLTRAVALLSSVFFSHAAVKRFLRYFHFDDQRVVTALFVFFILVLAIVAINFIQQSQSAPLEGENNANTH